MNGLILPIIFLIASVGLFFTFINPQYQSFKALRAELTDRNDTLEQAAQLDKVWQNIVNRNNSITSEQLDGLNKLLPDSVDTIRLITDINSIAARHNIIVKKIDVSKDEKPATAGTVAIGPNQQAYGVLGLSFSVSASYKNFLGFLEDLEHSLRIIDVTAISLKPSKETSYDYSVTAQTYWLK